MKKQSPFICLMIVLLAAPAVADDWPYFRGANRNGISNETGWFGRSSEQGAEKLWEKRIGSGCSSVVVKGGRLYTMGNTGKKGDPTTHEDVVYCFDAATGNEIWRHPYKCGLNFKSNTPTGPFAGPIIDQNKVYTFSRKGDAYCLNADTGKVIWFKDLKEQVGMKMPFQGGFAGSPLILDDMVVFNAGVAGTALDKRTGNVIWKSDPNVAAQATPVSFKMAGKQRLAMFSGFGIITVNAADGRQLWSLPWDTKYKTNVADPVIIGADRMFVSSWYKMGCAMLDITDGRIIWQNKEMQSHYSTCVLWQGHLYGFDVSHLKCMDIETGDVKWVKKEGLGRGSLILSDGKLIVTTESGTLIICTASPEKYDPLFKAEIMEGRCYAAPVLANGRIYARNNKSDLVCVTLNPDKK